MNKKKDAVALSEWLFGDLAAMHCAAAIHYIIFLAVISFHYRQIQPGALYVPGSCSPLLNAWMMAFPLGKKWNGSKLHHTSLWWEIPPENGLNQSQCKQLSTKLTRWIFNHEQPNFYRIVISDTASLAAYSSIRGILLLKKLQNGWSIFYVPVMKPGVVGIILLNCSNYLTEI